MKQRFPAVLRLAASLMCSLAIHGANATEVCKWTDANGQVHFGDCLSAPPNGKKIDVKVQPATPAPLSPPSIEASKGKSKSVDPSKVPAGCQDLIDQISKVKPGTNWEPLYKKFDANCHGIGYECNTYRTHPENNKCTWVERTGSNVLQTNNYE
jgi:hypothetical protein